MASTGRFTVKAAQRGNSLSAQRVHTFRGLDGKSKADDTCKYVRKWVCVCERVSRTDMGRAGRIRVRVTKLGPKW